MHRDHYVEELGRPGKVAAFLLETAPLRLLYRGSRFLTISKASADDIAAHGIPADQIDVNYIGVELDAFGPERVARTDSRRCSTSAGSSATSGSSCCSTCSRAYPGAVLDIAGEGDHRPELEAEIAERGLGDRVRMHGHVDEETQARAAPALLGEPDGVVGRGLVPDRDGGRGVRDAERGDRGRRAARVDRARAHRPAGATTARSSPSTYARLVRDDELRERLGRARASAARDFTWDRAAQDDARRARATSARRRPDRPPLRKRSRARTPAARPGLAAALMANNFIALIFTVVFARLLGASRLRHARAR